MTNTINMSLEDTIIWLSKRIDEQQKEIEHLKQQIEHVVQLTCTTCN